MSILYGFYEADSGEIRVDGKPTAHPLVRTTRSRAGIGMVHQHFMLVEPFTVLENVMLGAEGGALLRRRRSRRRAPSSQRLARDYGLEVDPDARRRRALGRPAAAGRDPQGARIAAPTS